MATDAELRAAHQSEGLKGGDPIPPLRADDHTTEDPAVETPVEARQGFLDRPVLVVLVVGLALAMLAWVAVELFSP
ncbi:hypothetical protein [Chelatococcus asaccharovorans]|uniref:Uncharacterized protein n=1 Tax=Chelatococcus asaccharovorans TaxID=28210 RepID=A0A2V3UAQ2_9HYPH|nr:hypothetical protein [Chelatococcus asaccharovorans]MBS7707671.1 hypothetical protein [Chelatococcus asaccharovorans]PXW55247.1 hypothetical protein C7450_110186 [Chelatococcus asaccharovorans]CAH1687704.1 conserved hypothetical protein [Chelatococcus asaccharovorans]